MGRMPVPPNKPLRTTGISYSVRGSKPVGRPLRLETQTRLVRSLRPSDACAAMASWFEDPVVLDGLNLPKGGISQDQLRGFVSEFDNRRKYLAGIFAKPENRLIGFYQIDVNAGQRVAQLSIAVGDKDYRGKNGSQEMTDKLIQEFFVNRSVDKFVARILASNYKALWSIRGTSFEFEAVLKEDNLLADGKRSDIVQFRCLKSGWRKQP